MNLHKWCNIFLYKRKKGVLNLSQLKVLHLTDTHILSNIKYSEDAIFKHFEEKNYSTLDSLKNVIKRDKQNFKDLDCVFVTGDLIHEGQEDDYRILKDFMESQFNVPVFYVLGNHDRTEAFNLAFDFPTTDEEYYYSTVFKGIRVIGLDSSHDNSGVGKVSNKQLSWLDKQMKEDTKIPTVILMHHPLKAKLSKDEANNEDASHMFLTNTDEVSDILHKGNVRAIFSGHTHSNFVNESKGLSNFINSGTAFFGEFNEDLFTMINRSVYGIALISEQSINYNNYFIQDEEKKELFSFKINSLEGGE